MNDEEKKPQVHPDVYEGLPEPERRVVDLLSAARFADDRIKERVRRAVLAAGTARRRPLLRPLVLVPAGLALLAAVLLIPRQAFRRIQPPRTSRKVYVDLSSRYYSAEELRAALGGS
jgi:hypothetical protein